MKALSRAVVQLYPAAWRERYVDEVLALVESGSIRLRDVFDLARGAITERILALHEPSRHISACRLISGLVILATITVVTVAMFIVGSVPLLVGYLFQVAFGPFSEELMETLGWVYRPMFVTVVCWSSVRLFKLRFAHQKSGTPLPPSASSLRMVVLAGYAGMIVLVGMETDPVFEASYSRLLHIVMPVLLLLQAYEPLSSIQWPGGNLLDALGRLRSARYDLRWGRMELERCEGLYERRDAGPELRAARSEMARLEADEARALGDLDAMGYHARFQR